MPSQSEAFALCKNIATAVFTKLDIAKIYNVSIRRHAEPIPMPWLEIAFCRIGRQPDTDEFCIALPESRYMVTTTQEKSDLATYVYKCVGMQLGKLQPKDK